MSVVNSPVDICNLGLIACGTAPITSLTDSSVEALLCNAIYGPTRDNLLRMHNWNFATITAQLTLSSEVTPGFAYTYQLPADFLKFVKIVDTPFPYKIQGNKLVSNYSDFVVEYIARITDVSIYDASFVDALSLAMAVKMIYKFNQSTNARQALKDEAKDALRTARTADGQEGTMDLIAQDTFLNSRYAGVIDGEI